MHRSNWSAAWVSTLVLVAVSGCNKGGAPADKTKPGATSAPATQVLAKVAGRPIRQEDVDAARAQLPQFRQEEFTGTRGTMRLVDQLIDREVIVKSAEDQGLDRDPVLTRQFEDIRRSLLIQAWQKKMVDALPKPTDQQIRDYYDQHPQEFVVPARVNASWILCATKADAEKARRRVVEKGEPFRTVATSMSTDVATAKDGGLLGYFNPTGYIRSVGPDTSFSRHAFELEADDVGPIFAWKNGYAFIKLHEKTTERTEPFDRAKERIQGRLTPTFNDSLLQANVTALRQKYPVKVMLDVDKELEGKPAEELMRMATEARTPADKIDYYRALLRRYPTYERADEAQFMIGFVYSEELSQFDKAKPEYEKMLQNYPQSPIRESAQYMLQNMGHGAPLPNFDEPGGTGGGSGPTTTGH